MSYGTLDASSSNNTNWTYGENKLFEISLARLGLDSPDLFENIKAVIPWKTVEEIKWHYQELLEDIANIEAGLIACPEYPHDDEHINVKGKPLRGGSTSTRRSGVPWTEEEHRLFLIGLEKYGKGDWKSISRDHVISKSPTQVASHAQKYFRRLNNSTPTEKRRYSINDTRIVNSAIVESSPRQRRTLRTGQEFPPPGQLLSQTGTNTTSVGPRNTANEENSNSGVASSSGGLYGGGETANQSANLHPSAYL